MKRRQFLTTCALSALPAGWARADFRNMPPAGHSFSNTVPLGSEAAESKPRIALITCGGAAQALCRGMRPAEAGLYRHLALDSSPRGMRSRPASLSRLIIDAGRKPKTPQAARQATRLLDAEIAKAIHGSDLLIIAAGLGGVAGTGIALGVQDLAADLGIPTLQVATQPFAFEVAARHQRARQALDELHQSRRHVLKIDLNLLLTARNQEMRLEEVLAVAREAFAQALVHTAGRWQQDSLAASDFADFQQLLGPAHESRIGGIGWGEARGAQRAQQAAWLALQHPLLRKTMREPGPLTGLSVTLRSAGETLRLAEVRTVMQMLGDHCGKDVPMLFDTASCASLGDSLQVSLWATRTMV